MIMEHAREMRNPSDPARNALAGHVVLLGDSIFDNASYVPGGPAVIDQVRATLPSAWRASLLAVDGACCSDVARQLAGLPPDATHLMLSVGGNDALGAYGLWGQPASSVGEAIAALSELQAQFRVDYEAMLRDVLHRELPTCVCTIYDAIPALGAPEQTALAVFNDVILRSAFAAGLPAIDLRMVCDARADYSPLSPIEPSRVGGAKIAAAIVAALQHDYSLRRTAIYGGRAK